MDSLLCMTQSSNLTASINPEHNSTPFVTISRWLVMVQLSLKAKRFPGMYSVNDLGIKIDLADVVSGKPNYVRIFLSLLSAFFTHKVFLYRRHLVFLSTMAPMIPPKAQNWSLQRLARSRPPSARLTTSRGQYIALSANGLLKGEITMFPAKGTNLQAHLILKPIGRNYITD